MPRPVEKKKRKPRQFAGLPMWMWAVLALFLLASTLGQCMFIGGGGA